MTGQIAPRGAMPRAAVARSLATRGQARAALAPTMHCRRAQPNPKEKPMRTLKALIVTSFVALPLVAAAAPPTKAPATGDAHATKIAKVHKPRATKSTKKSGAMTPAPTTPATPTPTPAPATK